MTFPCSEIFDSDILDYPLPPVFIENKTFLVMRVNRACKKYWDILHNLPVVTFRCIEHDHGWMVHGDMFWDSAIILEICCHAHSRQHVPVHCDGGDGVMPFLARWRWGAEPVPQVVGPYGPQDCAPGLASNATWPWPATAAAIVLLWHALPGMGNTFLVWVLNE